MNNEIFLLLSCGIAGVDAGVYILILYRNLLRLIIGVEIIAKGVTLVFLAAGDPSSGCRLHTIADRHIYHRRNSPGRHHAGTGRPGAENIRFAGHSQFIQTEGITMDLSILLSPPVAFLVCLGSAPAFTVRPLVEEKGRAGKGQIRTLCLR